MKPNIVFIVMDTARADFIDSRVKGKEVTPNLSEIINKGKSYTRTYSAAPWTMPSHASLFTGKYPSKHGAHSDHKKLNSDNLTIAEVLSRSGYQTAAISNNAWVSEAFGFGKGFDEFFKCWQIVQSDTDFGQVGLENQGNNKYIKAFKSLFKGNPVKNAANAAYAKYRFNYRDDDGAKRANKWITNWIGDRSKSSPFFLFVNYLEPHLEYRPTAKYADPFLPNGISYKDAMNVPQNAWEYLTEQVDMTNEDFEILRGLYAGELSYLDEKIGEIINSLKESGDWEETIFVVMGDHGENIGDHGLMDHQYCLYDTLLHVPLVAHDPVDAFTASESELVQLVDLAPSVLSAVDVDSSEFTHNCQGNPVLTSDESRSYTVSEYIAPMPSRKAIESRVGDPHNVYDDYNRSLKSISDGEFKLIVGSDGFEELYNISIDQDEENNIVDENKEISKRLHSELEKWEDSFEDADSSDSVEMDETTKQTLEDLGYIQ